MKQLQKYPGNEHCEEGCGSHPHLKGCYYFAHTKYKDCYRLLLLNPALHYECKVTHILIHDIIFQHSHQVSVNNGMNFTPIFHFFHDKNSIFGLGAIRGLFSKLPHLAH